MMKNWSADAAQEWLTLEFPPAFASRTDALIEYNLTANFLHPVYPGEKIDLHYLDEVYFCWTS